jgi:hypothetical protein
MKKFNDKKKNSRQTFFCAFSISNIDIKPCS